MSIYTKENISEILKNNQVWLERAILAIYKKQTDNEKRIEHSINHNDIGFNRPDANLLSYYAKYLISGKHLTGSHLEKARKKMIKYSGQLAKIANNKI